VIGHSFLFNLARLIHWVIHIYIGIIIIRAVISWMGNIPPNSFTYLLKRLTDPVFKLVYRILPYNMVIIGNFDISPIIIIVALYLIDSLVSGLLLDYAIQLRGG
jgi:YggT family protein